MVSARQVVASILRSARSRPPSSLPPSRSARAAGALCLLTATLSWAPLGFAQQAPAEQSASAPLEEVTVTGSRIKRTTDFTTPTPTTVIDATQMENMGIVNVGDALAMTPANVSMFTPQTTGASSFNTGSYIADLRGLNGFFGTRTLTLIDGQRAVPTSTGDSFDLNFVPQVLVQRIDTVTGGASAAYGSGAISGVVNVILDHQLEGGKLNVDEYDTHYNDAKEDHVSAAYGHGLFDNRIHFVIGAEYQKQDPALCADSGRAWCTSNTGVYTTGYSPSNTALTAIGTGLRTNLLNPNGGLGVAGLNPTTFGYTNTSGAPLGVASNDGLGLLSYTGNNAIYGGGGVAPGGEGEGIDQYTNLITGVKRSVITAMVSAKVTDSINANLQLNWGQVQANNPNGELGGPTQIGLDNAFLPAGTAAALGNAPNGYYLGKDWTSQIPEDQFNNTTVKRVSLGFDGKFGDSSWTWQGYGEYGLTENVEGSPDEFTATEAGMALDSVKGPNGQPECRITAGLNSAPGNPLLGLQNTLASAQATGYGGGGIANLALPSYLQSLSSALNQSGLVPPDPVTGLNEIQTLELLGQNCVPLNPFGTGQLAPGAANYATGQLSLDLRYTQTVFSLNTSGDIWKGIGAGAFSMAVGYEWRQEVVHNDFASCPPGQQLTDPDAYTLCLARTTDFSYQFGNPYGGTVNVDEAYIEFNAPLLKNEPFAHLLEVDIAGRDSYYKNETLYAVGLQPGSTGDATLPTWKASLLYEPVEGLRLRASQSRDSRAPDPRDLYYSQTFVAGSVFGTCTAYNNPAAPSTPCNINLSGNVNLKPETSNTTTVGLVATPTEVPGLQASADWYHIHIENGINGGSFGTATAGCGQGISSYCSDIVFNTYSYNAAGQPCGSGISGPLAPGGVNCAGVATKSGAAAYQQPVGASNILEVNDPAYNGAFYDTKGVDFSVTYTTALPGGSTLTARSLATWVGEQEYQNYAGAPVLNILGQTGDNSSLFGLGDYQTSPKWRGNVSLTWAMGGFSLTPNMSWVGQGTLDNQGVACNQAEFSNTSTLCSWIYNDYPDAGKGLPDSAAQTLAKAVGYIILPQGVANHVPSYFLFGLNAAYTFDNIPGIKSLQLFTQINNLLNKAPPFSASAGGEPYTNPVFFDQLGLAYRVGFRMAF
jgi:iron complex outermembrane recepter protein